MQSTVAGLAVSSAVHDMFVREPGWGSVLGEIVSRMNTGYYDQALVDTVVQNYDEKAPYTVYEAYCFGSIMTDLSVGRILKAEIQLEGFPGPNEHVEHNQSLLDDLPAPFYGVFHGNMDDSDGHVEWSIPLQFGQAVPDAGIRTGKVPACKVPLEVGTTHAWTTWYHLAFNLGVARVPYNSNRMTIMFRVSEI
ncbi:MAG: hypothetical protein IH855_01705 [Bacteroidetes bacterium]|nr:hypothetical protein [Bacteroidota bacterium]